MPWNWQLPDWPRFTYAPGELEPLERRFLLQAGEFIGAFKHIGPADQELLRIELISDEALKTSAIEGEVLHRESVQASLRQQFGIAPQAPRIPPAERGMAEMMVDLTLIPVSQVTTISSTSKPACGSRLTVENCERRRPA